MTRNPVFRSNYYILAQVGQGQFGRVYCGISRKTGKFVALKSLAKGFPTNRFLREFSCLISLRHPNIVSCQAIEYHGGGRYLVMDYCEGGTLRDLMNFSAKLNLKSRLDLVINILAGLEQAHKKNIIHCDIKPENILLSLTADKWVGKVTDFGIAKIIEQSSNDRGESGYTGSPAYMAPERFYGKYSYACDIYSVGIILYELMIGERPFYGLPGDLMLAHLNKRFDIPDTVPKPLQSIIIKALEKLPKRRFSSAKKMLEAINIAKYQLNINQDKPIISTSNNLSKFTVEINNFSRLDVVDKINHIVNNDENIYLASHNQLIKLSNQSKKIETINFNQSIKSLTLLSQGCLVLTEDKKQKICQYDFHYFSENKSFNTLDTCLQLESQDLTYTCDFKGKWLAIISKIDNEQISAKLTVLNLQTLSSFHSPKPCPFPEKLIFLNNRYGLAIFSGIFQDKRQTCFYLFNRRGHFIKGFLFPLLISKLTVNKSNAYDLFAVEKVKPNNGILIKLNPLKMTRIPLEFVPDFISGESWGYGLARTTGELLLLDKKGNYRSKINLGVEITAITGLSKNQLLIATLEDRKAKLLTLDLKELD
ncbi:serine/threonine-protein kinase [Crocosphaera sp. Alani8]|uniref:serine/threonine-protein kinase n=1 Tax=Crocosphaera sp. Alani8 TaxID=3038952 RepID=UPI00313D00B2